MTSSVTTLKNNYHGGAILAPHGTSRKMSGNVGTKKSDPPDVSQMDNRAKSDDQFQCRVKFDVVDSTDMRTELMANSKAPRGLNLKRGETARHHGQQGPTMRGGGRRADISEQQVPVDLKMHSRSADGPSLVARRVYKIPHSELQITEIDVTGDGTVFNHGPRRNRSPSSSRNSEKDKLRENPWNCDHRTVLIQIL